VGSRGNGRLRHGGFTVSDTGIEFPQIQKHIFDSFTQADGTTTRKYGGTGSGVGYLQTTCEMMGGEISVESEPDRGSTFRFSLMLEKQTPNWNVPRPLSPGLKELRCSLWTTAPPTGKSCTPDRLMGMETLRRRWITRPWRCSTVEGQGEPYDVVILDMMMPG